MFRLKCGYVIELMDSGGNVKDEFEDPLDLLTYVDEDEDPLSGIHVATADPRDHETLGRPRVNHSSAMILSDSEFDDGHCEKTQLEILMERVKDLEKIIDVNAMKSVAQSTLLSSDAQTVVDEEGITNFPNI